MKEQGHRLSANGLLALLLAGWWVLNMVTCGLLDLANDEAYYWAWTTAAAEEGGGLSWGYFDHPPMVALLVSLSSCLPGTFGVRFFTLLLQPLYLYLFWTLLRPQNPTRGDAWTYFLITFSIPMLQLYGLLALPDAPLLCFTVVFLWALKRLDNGRTIENASLLAVAMALLVYSKYHGVLVILLALAAYLRKDNSLFKSGYLYYAGVLAVVLFIPHLLWQAHHDFDTFAYHLLERSGDGAFDWGNVGGFLLTLAVVYNPAWWFFAKKGSRGWWQNSHKRALLFVLLGFVAFFLLSSLRDNTQAQWTLPVLFAIVAWTFEASTQSDRFQQWVRRIAIVSGLLLQIARVLLVVNPWGWGLETWQQRTSCEQIAKMADGRPVLFTNDYASAAKYCYYGRHEHRQGAVVPIFYGRESQWKYSCADDRMAGKDVLIVVSENDQAKSMPLVDGSTLEYVEINNFLPLRKVEVEVLSSRIEDDTAEIEMVISNPYDYALSPTSDNPLLLTFFWRESQRCQPECNIPLTDTLPAHTVVRTTRRFALTGQHPADHSCGISLRYALFRGGRNSRMFYTSER